MAGRSFVDPLWRSCRPRPLGVAHHAQLRNTGRAGPGARGPISSSRDSTPAKMPDKLDAPSFICGAPWCVARACSSRDQPFSWQWVVGPGGWPRARKDCCAPISRSVADLHHLRARSCPTAQHYGSTRALSFGPPSLSRGFIGFILHTSADARRHDYCYLYQ